MSNYLTKIRDKKILELRNDGYSLVDIGIIFRLSRERVRQIIEKYQANPDLSTVIEQ